MNDQSIVTQMLLEHQVLGCLVKGPYVLEDFVRRLCPETFVDAKNREIFRTIMRQVDSGNETGVVPLLSDLQYMDKKANVTMDDIFNLPDSNGQEGLSALISNLEDRRMRRELDLINRVLATKIADDGCEDIGHEVEVMTRKMQEVIEGKLHKFTSLTESSNMLMGQLGTPHRGLHTGLPFIDDNGGLPLNGLTVIGAGTSQGKSALALCISLEAAAHGHRIAYISLEMSTHDLTQRILAIKSGLECTKIRRNVIDDIYEQGLLAEAAQDIQLNIGESFFFEDSHVYSLDQIKQSIRAMHHSKKIDVAVIDYLQIMAIQYARHYANIEQQLALAARELHNLAKDCGIAIIAISQLNRDRENEEPQLSRLRDSAQIADAADAVILIYRPEVYGKNYSGKFRNADTHNTALIKVAKMRQGATGDFLCGFQPEFTRFYHIEEKTSGFNGF